MAKKDLAYGGRAIRNLLDHLEEPQDLAHLYALAVLTQAKRNAASRPTPQAPMAARNMNVEHATIGPSAGGPAQEVGIGSEFGSALYPQFQKPPNQQGYWLYPATWSVEALTAAEEALQDVLQQVANGR